MYSWNKISGSHGKYEQDRKRSQGRGNAKNSNEKKMPRKNGGAGRKEGRKEGVA
jgi:hypothetical protein